MTIAMWIGGYMLAGIITVIVGSRMDSNDRGKPINDGDLALWWTIGVVIWPLFVVGYIGYRTVVGIGPTLRYLSTPARIRKVHQAKLEHR